MPPPIAAQRRVLRPASGITIPTPTLFFNCNEGSGNLLETVSSLDMTDFNTVGATTGIVSGCRSFIRTNSECFFRASDNAAFQLQSTGSIVLWVYVTSSTGVQYFVARDKNNSGGDYHIWFDSSGNTLKFNYRYLTTNYFTITIASGISTGTWYCIGVKWDGVNIYSSLNGAAWGGAVSAIVAPITDATFTPIFGGRRVTGSLGDCVNGRMDIISFFNGILLTDAQISQFYNSGSGKEYSGGVWS